MSTPSNSDSYKPVLTAREHGRIELLARLYYLNHALQQQPSKWRLAGQCANSTRSLRYKSIDRLISQGLVTNEGTNKRYALQLTENGNREVQYWASKLNERDHK